MAIEEIFKTDGLPENQKALLEGLTPEQIELISGRTEAYNKSLEANRDAILAEKRQEEEQRKKAEELLKIQDEQTNKIKADLEAAQQAKEMEEAEKSKDNERIKELQQQAFDKEREQYLNAQKELEQKAQTLLQEKNDLLLTNSLSQANITKEGFEAVKSLMQSRMSLTEDNEIMLEGAPLTEYLQTWTESDEGKYFVKAPPMNGSGSTSGTGGTKTTKTWAELSVDEKATLRRTEPEKAAELSKAV